MLSIGMKIEKRENKPKNTILKERGLIMLNAITS